MSGYYPQHAYVARLTADSDSTSHESFVAHPGFPDGIRINVQPASPEFTALHEGIQGKMFQGFTTASGVVEGFKLTMSGTGEEYIVRGRKPYFYGRGQHAELVLVAKDR